MRKRYSEKLKASHYESNRQKKENIDNKMRTMGSAANDPIDLDDFSQVGSTFFKLCIILIEVTQ